MVGSVFFGREPYFKKGSGRVTSRQHIEGLDTFRFIAALWVVFSHGGAFPLKTALSSPGPVMQVFIGIYDCLFNGVAAVVVFFIISGFCIHYPWVNSVAVDIRAHLIRRYVRIGIPLLVVVGFVRTMGADFSGAADAVLWSVYCELIYYSLYPALFVLFRRIGIYTVLVFSITAALILIASHDTYLFPMQFPISLNWLVCMPAWLLGCLLAERVSHHQLSLKIESLPTWRLAALVYTTAATVMVFHGPVKIGYPASMLLFSLFAFFWLERELCRFLKRPPYVLVEWLGTWSYSVYLIHNLLIAGISKTTLSPVARWSIMLPAIFVGSYIFARLVEFPSHQAARYLALHLRPKQRLTIDR